MKCTVNIMPGMYFARGNDFIEITQVFETYCIVHYLTIDMKYDGAGYMTTREIENYINKNGFHIK